MEKLKIEELEDKHYQYINEVLKISKADFLDAVEKNDDVMDDIFDEIAILSEENSLAEAILNALIENFDDRDNESSKSTA